MGIDVFLDWDENGRKPRALGDKLKAIKGSGLKLKMITNRGVVVYPGGFEETFCTDHWRCRFMAEKEGTIVKNDDLIQLLSALNQAGFDCIKTENLYNFDGERGYSLGQGE